MTPFVLTVQDLVYPLTSTMLQYRYNILTPTYTGYGGPTKPFYKHPLNENGQNYYYTEDMQVDSMIHRHDESYQPILDTISRDNFSNLFQRPWANSLIKYHPEYSKLQIAEGVLRRSYEWLDSLQAIDIYSTAHSNGFDNPLALPSSSSHPDPFFLISGNSAYRDTLDKRIRNGIIIGSGLSASGPTIWQLANSAVLCAGVDSANKPACTMALSGAALTGLDPSITNAAQKNKVWEEFRAIYLGYRNEMVLKYINAQTGVLSRIDMDTLLAQGKELVFDNMKDAATHSGAGSWWTIAASGDTTGLGTATGGIINTYQPDICTGQKPFWKARLLQCEALIELLITETNGDSTTVRNIIDSILVKMVSVCNNSRDSNNYYGASNVRPGYGGTPIDFESVINPILKANGIDTLGAVGYFCNPYTIDFPKPYGKNPQVFTVYSDKIDSCGCERFAALKAEAHALSFDTLSFSSMNQFFQENYFDSLSLVLWNGLQQCDSAYIDSCISTWGEAEGNPFFTGKIGKNDNSESSLCTTPVIYSITWISSDSARIYYNSGTTEEMECGLTCVDLNTGLGFGVLNSCLLDFLTVKLNPCHTYVFTVSNIGCGFVRDTLLPRTSCICEQPEITSVEVASPNPTAYTQNVTIHYTVPSGATSCKLYTYYQTSTTPYYIYTLDCDTTAITIELPSCYKYDFLIRSTIDTCLNIPSDTARLDSCWHDSCFVIFNPIQLPEYVAIPSFLNCDYVKPCITCATLDSLTTEFRTKFPFFSSVPYLDSTTTEAQAKENDLWARFLNYRTGFSKNTHDYLVAYNNCDIEGWPPMNAICSFTKPLNDPSDVFVVDTMPCRNVQTQAEFITQLLYQKMKDSLIARFDSLYKAKCFAAKDQEQFYATYQPKEYHYTLYYYDQAGNLVKTIPPAGVKPNFNSTYLASVAARGGRTDVDTSNNECLLPSTATIRLTRLWPKKRLTPAPVNSGTTAGQTGSEPECTASG